MVEDILILASVLLMVAALINFIWETPNLP